MQLFIPYDVDLLVMLCGPAIFVNFLFGQLALCLAWMAK